MDAITYKWRDGPREYTCQFVRVPCTAGNPYAFGEAPGRRIDVGEFFVASTAVTQALWVHVMRPDANPEVHRGPELPVENVSWDDLNRAGGFLDRVNASAVGGAVRGRLGAGARLRLPSETEWEYAARGGPHWRDGYRFSGGDDADMVAWYDRRHGDHTQPVAGKLPNQLGLAAHGSSGAVTPRGRHHAPALPAFRHEGIFARRPARRIGAVAATLHRGHRRACAQCSSDGELGRHRLRGSWRAADIGRRPGP